MFKKIFLLMVAAMAMNTAFAQENYSYNVKQRGALAIPGQTLANICGYWQNGKEYALLGASQGMMIVDVTDPDVPKQITQLPGPNNLWKEIKVYKNYAYVTSEGGQGLQCVDLSTLPAPNVNNVFYTGDGDIDGKLNKIHALHIDTLKGVLYCFGATGVSNSGATMLDIKTNPMQPKYLGSVDKDYIHDGYIHNDTLFAGHIYRGDMEIWYTGDKKKPVSLGKVATPTKFTHNIWLSENRKYAYTTDENNNSFLAAYDISDPADIKLVDKIATNPGSGAVVHNTHIINDFAVSSYYTEGFTIVDAHQPDNLVEVARFDTYLPKVNPAAPFEGAWGVFPYFPSGTIVISNIDEGLFIFTPTYKRAAYIEGIVTNKLNQQPLSNVLVTIEKYVTADANSSLKGEYKTGVSEAGTVKVTFSKGGFKPLTLTTTVKNAVTTILNAELEPLAAFSMSVQVQDAATGAAIADADVSFVSFTQSINKKTNINGDLSLTTYADTATIYVGKWGYSIVKEDNVFFNTNLKKVYKLKKGYQDPFIKAMPFGWTATGSANAGAWVMGEPLPTQYNGQIATPDEDDTKDIGTECFITGNEAGQPGSSDVDNGDVILTSPTMDLTTYKNPAFKFSYWFFNGGGAGSAPNDSLYMIINNGKSTTKVLVAKGTTSNKWNSFDRSFKGMGITPTATTTVAFVAVDENAGHIVKAAVDNFEVVESAGVNTNDIDNNINIVIAPNPFTNQSMISYSLDNDAPASLVIVDVTGRAVEQIKLSSNNGTIVVGQNLAKGFYFAQILQADKMSKAFKFVKE
jgi:choice-of-anchor B domain-containing protein